MSDSNDSHGEGESLASPALRAEALELLLEERGLVTSAAVDSLVDRFENDIGPLHGVQVVVRAWTDPEFKQRLLRDGTSAIAELDLGGEQTEHLVVKENSTGLHNVIVCTLCSCYPWAVLGLPPTWYKSPAYRSRVVREPRKVLAELGLDLQPSIEVRVWDSTAEVRYMVLPQRPEGTEEFDRDQLAELVSRDSMIGVAVARAPSVER